MSVPIALIMGSQSDWDTMRHAAETLTALGIAHDRKIVSAHRTPDRLVRFAKGAKAAGSIAELGAMCDHVGICVVNDADVDQICAALIPTRSS